MSRPTAVLICPGRGSYTREELGFVGRTVRAGPIADALAAADAAREAARRPTLSAIDAAEKFRPGLHLDGGTQLVELGIQARLTAARRRLQQGLRVLQGLRPVQAFRAR